MLHASNMKKQTQPWFCSSSHESVISDSLTNDFECITKAEENSFRLDDFTVIAEVLKPIDK